ncbi:type I-E CRISPR-associated protein Cse2/CasB [Streptomyces sp. NBC_00335]|uniref:type I-E CRISPR-associated protein Cse2/CasB n=1 Tax=unclassified Streptomyces TaxID=2593676 RepID=UPI0022581BCB|nr:MULTISPECIES: type I-E CRISPR-associated protein Cse2/CasB [unclassified Streptomyces]MCX5409802.1 type I-E CRISPR-associated protein Cse2/CasB [Streptomyces sp. NBC_00086]
MTTRAESEAKSGPKTSETSESSAALTAWLASLVHNRHYGSLADLRRPRVRKEPHFRAIWYSPGVEQEEIYEQVAFLFAVYHQGKSEPSYGYGSLGEAARRIGSGEKQGPEDPGAARLVDRIVSSRRIPWRHLQHTVARLRACGAKPPSWARLADDLSQWNDRKARVSYEWAVDFHNSRSRAAGARTAGTIADPTQKGTTT